MERVDSYKYLGILLDSQLKFDEHVSYVKQKTFTKIKLLGRLKWVLDRETLLLLYKTLILPIIDYGDMAYHGLNQQDAHCLQKLQNIACRAILRADMRTHIDEMHGELQVSTLYQRRCQHIVTLVFKFLNGMGPTSCCNLLQYVCCTHTVQTRASENQTLHVPLTRLKVTDNDFTVIGPKLWNQLPFNIKSIGSLEEFKVMIKTFIFE